MAWAVIGVLTACGSSTPQPPSITAQPQSTSATEGAVAVFGVTAAGDGALTYQWRKNGTSIAGANTSTYFTAPVTMGDSGASFSVTVTNAVGSTKSTAASLTVAAAVNIDVPTYHNDTARTGQNIAETRLTPANVTQAHFRKLKIFPADGKIYAQPLVVSNLSVNGTVRNVLYTATEHDTVFAYDADTGLLLWKTSLLAPGEVPSDDRGCDFVTPEIGVTATPVIDRDRGAIYVIAASVNTDFVQRLHALSLTTGAEMFGGPTQIPAVFPGINQTFYAWAYVERSALLLANGRIYTSWASHCDTLPYTSWVITFDASTLQVSQVFNGELGDPAGRGAFWNSGSGPAADAAGNVYLLMANGTFDTTLDADGFPAFQDYGNSMIRLAPPAAGSSTIAVHDYFSMYNTVSETSGDTDLGSGGGILLPDLTDETGTTRQLMVGAGKDKHIYVVERDNMGKFNAQNNAQIWQDRDGGFQNTQYGNFGGPVYFNNVIYFGPVGGPINAIPITNAKLSTSTSSISATKFPYPGAAISISANGTQNGILWAIENSSTQGVLHAYDASDLTKELYNSSQSGSRDAFGPGSKYVPPTIANGKVYVTTQVDLTKNPNGLQEGVAVFGPF